MRELIVVMQRDGSLDKEFCELLRKSGGWVLSDELAELVNRTPKWALGMNY